MLAVLALEVLGKLRREGGCLLGGGSVPLDVLAGVGGLLLRGLAALGDLRPLGQGSGVLALEAPALGRGGGDLRLQARHLALRPRVLVAGLGERELELSDLLARGLELVAQPRRALLERADTALALERARLVGGKAAHVHAAVRQHAYAVLAHVGERRGLRVREHGLRRPLDEPHVPEKRLEERPRLLRDVEPGDERHARGALRARKLRARGVARDDRRAPLDARERRALGGHRGRVLGTSHHKGREIVAQKTLDKPLDLGVRVDEVGQAALHAPLGGLTGRELGRERARVLHLRVHAPQGLERGLRAGKRGTRVLLGAPRGLELVVLRVDVVGEAGDLGARLL